MTYRNLLILVLFALSACGGGGGGSSVTSTPTGGTTTDGGTGTVDTTEPSGPFSFDTGLGGSGGIIGPIFGFGSVIINGLEMETDDVDIFIEGESASESDLKVGYYIVLAGDLGSLNADEIYYRANLKGPVSAPPQVIDALTGRYQLVVLGQTVITTAATRLDGVLLANIAEGNELEISGPIDSEGRVIASYIELESSLAEYKAVGNVTNLDSTGKTFDLGGLTVDYASAALSEFEGASLANGQLVEVRMPTTSFTPPAAASAAEVELLPVPSIDEGAELEIEGIIDRFTSATDFSVNGIAIISDGSTTFENGSAAQLGLNVRVEVEGVANASGVIIADNIEFETDEAVRIEGVVTEVTTTDGVTGTVTTQQGVTFTVRDVTEIEDESSASSGTFTLADLMLGDYVRIRGFIEGNDVIAVELEKDDADTRALLRGPLTGFDQTAATVEIQGVTVNELDGTTEYENALEAPVDRDTFYGLLPTQGTGTSLKAEWDDFGTLSDPADKLSIEDDD